LPGAPSALVVTAPVGYATSDSASTAANVDENLVSRDMKRRASLSVSEKSSLAAALRTGHHTLS